MKPLLLHGLNPSYFTRKMAAYLDYKGIPYVLRRFSGFSPEADAAGFPGGMPTIETPEGEFMWDSTSMIHHFELRVPEPSIFPPDSVRRFLDYVIEDALDEWYYRAAVGSRWHFAENYTVGGWEIAREISVRTPLSGADSYAMTTAHMHSTLRPFGVTPENVGGWIDDVLRPWMRVVGAHLAAREFVFGARPSLADFTLFGGAAAHYVNDPLCRRWLDEDAPAWTLHTHRLIEPGTQTFGPWERADEIPATLIDVLREIGRTYLPWVSRACDAGEAEVSFVNGTGARIRATDFLRGARGVLLARYAALRSPALDAVLARAGILEHFAGYVEHAGAIPDDREPPRPALNRPFPPE